MEVRMRETGKETKGFYPFRIFAYPSAPARLVGAFVFSEQCLKSALYFCAWTGTVRKGRCVMVTQSKRNVQIRAMVVTAILAAMSYILAMMSFSVPFMPSFIKLDVSELPALIGSFSLGPVYGVLICLIKNLLGLMNSGTNGIGELSNFLLGAMFVFPAGLLYQRNKTRKGST